MTQDNNNNTPDIEEIEGTVNSFTGHRPFMGLTKQGTFEQTGVLSYTDMNNRQVRSMTFTSNETGRQFGLGNVTSSYQLIDQRQVFGPLLDLGFEVGTIRQRRGGAATLGILRHPGMLLDDPIRWDRGLGRYEHSELEQASIHDGKLAFSIMVKTDARAGNGIKMTAGFFRFVCENGLTVETLKLGSLSIPQKTFNPNRALAWATDMVDTYQRREAIQLQGFGIEALNFPIKMLDAISSPDIEFDMDGQPQFIQEPLATITALPKWAQGALSDELKLIQNGTELFTAMDIVNALTNLGHSTGRSDTNIYFRADRWMSALIH